jgi:cytochrome c oxidase subunit 1
MPRPAVTFSHDSLLALPATSARPQDAVSPATGTAAARGWFLLAIGSLVLAGLLSLLLVIGRLPFLGWLFTDPLFFKRALVVHVDLAIVVWFQAGTLAFLGLALGPRLHRGGTVGALALATAGVAGMLTGAVMPGAQPVLANYVPVIDHPVFFTGLVCWFAGAGLFYLLALFTPARNDAKALSPGVVNALRAAAAANVIAILTFLGAWRTTPDAVPAVYYELVFWGGGHVLQAANVAAMLALWLHLLHRWTGSVVLAPARVAALVVALVLPQVVMVPLAFGGTTETAYFSMATHLMRWTLFPVVLVVLAAAVVHVRRHRAGLDWRDYRFAGLAGSATLTLLGFGLGALIRGSSTLVPGHYHCAIGAVTIALMAAAYDFCAVVAPAGQEDEPPRRARLQLLLFGGGQAVFGLGFALAGAYGLGRKQYGAEQHVRSVGEYLGLSVMGLGGLVAVAGGIFFLAVMLRRIRTWRRSSPSIPQSLYEQQT